MSGYSLFQTSTLGMMAQAHALNTIGNNIANVSTGGFKRTETRFATVLSKTLDAQSDLGGVKPKDFQIIDQQGQLQATRRDLDLAIAGGGFFQVSPTQQVSGQILGLHAPEAEPGIPCPPPPFNYQIKSIGCHKYGVGTLLAFSGMELSRVRPRTPSRRSKNMSGYSLFQTSTLGMMAQAHALNTIGNNIANVSTGGFKRTETRFATVLSKTLDAQSDLGGVKPKDFQIIDQQGQLQATRRDLDLAIAGGGFFQVSPTQQVSGQILFTRDGSFEINFAGAEVTATADDGSTINVRQGFLTDKNGFFVLGVAPQSDGTFTESSPLQSLRVDQFAISNQSSQTTTAKLSVNLPANNKFGDPNESTSLTIIDSNGKIRALTVSFVKTSTINQWQMVLSGDDLPSPPVVAAPLIFSQNATLTSPLSITINLTWSDGATNSFALDLTDSSQFASDFLLFDFSQNGLSSSSLQVRLIVMLSGRWCYPAMICQAPPWWPPR